jgi:hypothetical protein
MKYFIALSLLALTATWANGQSKPKVTGLGSYTIGITTPKDVASSYYSEELVKMLDSTATPCTHVRTFTRMYEEIAGVSIMNLQLRFYDDTLCSIKCDYTEELTDAFHLKYGKGIPEYYTYPSDCKRKGSKYIVTGERWKNGNVSAILVKRKGFDDECKVDNTAHLEIDNDKLSSPVIDCLMSNLSSDIKKIVRDRQAEVDAEKKAEAERISEIKRKL